MSIFGAERRPVYRVYQEDEYDGDTESFAADAQTELAGVTGQKEPVGAGGLELRRRAAVFLVMGLLVLVATVAVVLVLSNASRRAPGRPAPTAPAVTTATAGDPRTVTASPMRTSAPRNLVRRLRRASQPLATPGRTVGAARASAHAPVVAPVKRLLSGPPVVSVTAEFGFER